MAMASACTAGGWRSPARTSVVPRGRRRRSRAAASAQRRAPASTRRAQRRARARHALAHSTERDRHRGRDRRHVAPGAAQALVGHGAGDAEHRLDRVQAHAFGPAAGAAKLRAWRSRNGSAPRKSASSASTTCARSKSYCGLQRAPERRARAVDGRASRARRVKRHAHLGMAGPRALHQRVRQRRARRLEQQAQPRAAIQSGWRQAIDRRAPVDRVGVTPRPARAIRIVELQDQRLLEDAAAAQAGRVFGVSLDLGRPPLVALDQQAGRVSVEHRRRRVDARDPRRQLRRLPHVGHDALRQRARAARARRQRQARAQQPRERRAAIELVGRLLRRSSPESHRWHGRAGGQAVDLRGRDGRVSDARVQVRRRRTAQRSACERSARDQVIDATAASGRRCGSGSRWQSRHQPMVSGATW